MTGQCPPAIITLCIQSVVGALLMAFTGGIMLAKFLRPKHRTQHVIFSDKAVICTDNGELCFMFRVADIACNRTHLVESHIRLFLARRERSQEGFITPFKLYDMNVGYDFGLDRILFLWPNTIRHVINAESPLFGITARDLKREKLEIIAVLEGNVENTGMTAQARTSWIPSEIRWGHRFRELGSLSGNRFRIQYAKFHSTFPVSEETKLMDSEIECLHPNGNIV